jgi:flavin-binding protein dodecin
MVGGLTANDRREGMSVARVTEITASSSSSFDDAVKQGIDRASNTQKNVAGAWVQAMTVKVDNGQVTEDRVNMTVTFVLED